MTMKQDRAALRATAVRIIDHITNWPILSNKDVRKDWLAPPPLSEFRRLEPIGFGLERDEEWWIFNPEDCPPDLVWPLDVGLVASREDDSMPLVCSRLKTVTVKEVRGYASRFSPFMLRMDHLAVDRGKRMTAAALYAWVGGQWTDAEKRVLWNRGEIPSRNSAMEQRDRGQPRLASAVALRQRYEWAVSFGLEKTPTIRFATDPTGMKDMFRIRDLPEGRDRRAALMTWVEDHWRQDRHDPEMEVYVRRHLRGAVAFIWQGLTGEIIPSQFDVDTRDRLVAERAAMREAGTDRRVA